MHEVVMTREEYLQEVGNQLCYGDRITMTTGEGDWDGDDIIEFRNGCGCLLSRFNCDKEIAQYE